MGNWFNGAAVAYCWAAIVAFGTLEIVVPLIQHVGVLLQLALAVPPHP